MNKQKCYAWVLSLAAIVGATACHEDIGLSDGSAVGKIAPMIELNKSVSSSKKSASRAEGDNSQITAQDLTVTLTKQSSSARSNNSYSFLLKDFDSNQTFPVGSYLVEASYGEKDAEGFDCPYYYGYDDITIEENKSTPVSITATLAQSMVTVKYTEQFKNYMTAWSAEIVSEKGPNPFAEDETNTPDDDADYQPVYVVPGSETVYVSFTKPNGQSAKLKVGEFTGLARYHYTMTVDIDGGAGDVALKVQYDESLEKEEVVIDLSDELMSAPAPTITGVGVENGGFFQVKEGETFNKTVKANIVAKGGLGEVILVTNSEDLIAAGWPAKLDLMKATDAQQATLKSLGLSAIGLWKNPEKMAVIDFTNVLSHTENAVFSLIVTDVFGKTSEEFQFSYKFIESQVEITSVDQLVNDATTLKLTVSYGGSSDIAIKYTGGEWGSTTPQAASVISKTEVSTGVYEYTLNVGSGDSYEFFATAGSKESNHVKVTRVYESVTASVDDNDVFATSATITGTITDSSKATSPQVAYREQGTTDWTYAGSTATRSGDISVKVTGLKDNTTYEYTGANNGTAFTGGIKTFTTETATQLPNSDMESWYTVAGSTSNWWKEYPGSDENAVWGTNNLLTTSQGGSNTLATTNRNGCAYSASSGTIATTDSHNGKAALIRTQGWGSGNNAVGTSGWGLTPTCKYIDAGLLHLGTGRTSRESGNTSQAGSLDQTGYDTGYSFTSRPSSMSFWYKYTAKNSSDHGTALITVYNGNNVIATCTADLGAKDAYEQVKIDLNYVSGAAKATKIYVRFMSTYSTDFLTLTTSNMNYPDYGNTSDGMYYGSQLYIDDIELNY